MEPTKPSDIIVVRVKLVFIVIGGAQVGKVDLVSQQTTDATESLDELRALLRPVRYELQVRAKLFVLLGEPFKQGLRFLGLFHLNAR